MIFEQLASQHTPLGEISLRRRTEPKLDGLLLYEVKLGDEFLMSSLFTEAEQQLAILALAALSAPKLDVVIGGLGLGYTAVATLANRSVQSLLVVEMMQAVIDWHQRRLVPMGEQLTADPRCKLLCADFFEMALSKSFNPLLPAQKVHAVLLDIDHSPSHWLGPEHSRFYCHRGLVAVAEKLHPGGVFGLWSNDPPAPDFIALLDGVFAAATANVITFDNPYNDGVATNTVYIANKQP